MKNNCYKKKCHLFSRCSIFLILNANTLSGLPYRIWFSVIGVLCAAILNITLIVLLIRRLERMADPLILILPFQSRSMHSAKTGSFVEKCMDLKTVI